MTTTTLRDRLSARRQARAAQRNLHRELTSYSTHAEVTDLLAMLERQEGADVDEMRTILTRQLQRDMAPLSA